ncbi:hypothetical protein LBMAG53_10640 [Planctomycetota bacterium]|nr:hypothetical protein LBMAG53_10640 [Planctomycetota bacterium]
MSGGSWARYNEPLLAASGFKGVSGPEDHVGTDHGRAGARRSQDDHGRAGARHVHDDHHHHAGHDHAGRRLPAGPAGLGFPAGALRRILAAAGFAAGGVLLAWTVERPDARAAPGAALPQASSAPRIATLTCETTSPAQWRITLGGTPITPTDSTPQRWIGQLPLPVGRISEILIEADAAGATNGPRALRLRLAGDGPPVERVVWGDGDLVESVRVGP